MKISYTAPTLPSPDFGGFYVAFDNTTSNGTIDAFSKYRRGQRIIHKIMANIPSGRTLNFASNGYGNDGYVTFLSPQTGTGNWEEYVILQQIGTIAGTFSSTGFYYIAGGATASFDWYVSECTIVDVDSPPEVQYSSGLTIGYDTTYNGTATGFGGLGMVGNALIAGYTSIGTNATDYKLEVYDARGGTATARLRANNSAVDLAFTNTSTTSYIQAGGTNMYFYAAGGSNSDIVLTLDGTNNRAGIITQSPAYPLDVTGVIRATSDIIAYSDARVKENIVLITGSLDIVKKLRGVTYTRKDIEDKSQKIGVIAQEVLEVLPQVVQQDENGYYSVAYGNIVGVLIEAIKEQQKQIDELKILIKNK